MPGMYLVATMAWTETCSQIDRLALDSDRPAILCDVDEVVVHFIAGLENFLARQGLWLDPASFALNGNIKTIGENRPIDGCEVKELIARFYAENARTMQPIKGAVCGLKALSNLAEIVFLSNIGHEFYQDRRCNLAEMGLDFPFVSNHGPKGPAAARLFASHNAPVIFIDDISHCLLSVHEACRHIQLVHFTQDQRFARHVKPLDVQHFRTDNWQNLQLHIFDKLTALT